MEQTMHRFILTIAMLIPLLHGCEKPESANAAKNTSGTELPTQQTKPVKVEAKVNVIDQLSALTQIRQIATTDKTMHILVAPKVDARIITATLGENHDFQFGVYQLKAANPNAIGGADTISLHPDPLFKPVTQTPWEQTSDSEFSHAFRRNFQLQAGTDQLLDAGIIRTVRVMSGYEIRKTLEQRITDSQLQLLGYESINRLKNTHIENPWPEGTPAPGLKSSGSFEVNENMTLIIPHTADRQTAINNLFHPDSQFTDIQSTITQHPDKPLLFIPLTAENTQTLIIPHQHAAEFVGFYDHSKNVLSFVFFNLYKSQDKPAYPASKSGQYTTDGYPVQITFNDRQLTVNFYSTTKALKAGHSIRHRHRTVHVQGSDESLDRITTSFLGIPLKDITHRPALASH